MADDTELDYNINFFVKSHCGLIDAEYEEEKQEFKYDTAKPEVGNLEKKGVLINDLTIINVRSEYGSCIVEFGKTSVGDIASVWYHNEDDENRKTFLASGTVIFVGDIIKMSFDNSNPFNWDYEKYFIVKTPSDVTFKRMKNALQNIINHAHGRCSMITKHLFGFTKLEKSAISPNFLNEKGTVKFYNNNLHSTQKEAIKFCLEQRNFAIVHGPPGTGKTTVLIEIILQLVNTGHKVLVCAPSNIAVDTLVERLNVIKSKIIRVGKIARMLESSKSSSLGAVMSTSDDAPILKDVKDELEQHQKELEKAKPGAKAYLRHEIRELKKEYYRRQYKALQELLKRASVVLTTLTSASEDGDLRNVTYEHFDVVIIDECSQAIEAACWIAIPRAPKLIIAGDHLQLPPTIKSKTASDCGLGVSLMERAILRMGPECFKLLTHQYRMNSSIMQWVSSFYNNQLVADSSVANRLLKDLPNVKETELTVLDIERNGRTCQEAFERRGAMNSVVYSV
ncbi:Regulator of nonsense transcripts 1 homolog [Gryllus bimaculatus]|nr:Regulator of nonsense transcripts 1 homolog [Gryllus bimaculatus]